MHKLVISLLAFAALSGCAVPKYLVADDINGGRVDKVILVPSVAIGARKNQVQLYDFTMRLCDAQQDGTLANCKDSLILTNVTAGAMY